MGDVSRKGDEKDKRGGIIKMRQDELFGWQIIKRGPEESAGEKKKKKEKWKIANCKS